MPRSDDLYTLPPNLPVPVDDGAADHLRGAAVPPVALRATGGGRVRLATLPGRTVVYAYPRTGHPDRDPPPGWDQIPGARGCTPQSCSYRDHHAELRAHGARVFGLSTQPPDEQQEVADRLHLPYSLLSDSRRILTRAMSLPTFTIQDFVLLKRLTLILRDGEVEHVFYPVFPPDADAGNALAWLAAHPLP